MDYHAFDKLSYGLYIVSSEAGGKAAGCIVNTLGQVTVSPVQVAVTINKENQTTRTILESGKFSATVLAESASMELIGRFGFQCSRDVDKFADVKGMARATNGVYYLPYSTNAFVSGKVTQEIDLGTHTLFIADVTEARVLSGAPSMTYSFYFANVKPKPAALTKQTGWVCKICGYVYEGETLPADFICPLCKHGAEDFEKLPD